MATGTGNIEFVQGTEQHTSNWAKYYVKGLEAWRVKEDFAENKHDKHHDYDGYRCNGVPEGTLFTIFEQNGNKLGTDLFIFAICITTTEEVSEDKSCYGSGWTKGNFKIIVQANSKIKAPRLMDWWIDNPQQSLALAEHCKIYIDKRGVKELPPMPIAK